MFKAIVLPPIIYSTDVTQRKNHLPQINFRFEPKLIRIICQIFGTNTECVSPVKKNKLPINASVTNLTMVMNAEEQLKNIRTADGKSFYEVQL